MKSIYNHVARDLLVDYDWTWHQIRRALDNATVAVDSVDTYREVYARWNATNVYVDGEHLVDVAKAGSVWCDSAASEVTP